MNIEMILYQFLCQKILLLGLRQELICIHINLAKFPFKSHKYKTISIDVWEGTSGTSADVPIFGLKIHFYRFTNRFLDYLLLKNLDYSQFSKELFLKATDITWPD